MELAAEDIYLFQELYKVSFDIELDEDTAKAIAQHLIKMMLLVYRPITKDEYDNLNGNYHDTDRSKKNIQAIQ